MIIIKKSNAIIIICNIVLSCLFMALIETIIEPTYIIKSLAKIVLFLVLPAITMKLFIIKTNDKCVIDKKEICKYLLIGILIYMVIIAAYVIANRFFDFSSLVNSLSTDQNVSGKDFIIVAAYISLCNSFLEEFFFRYVSFIRLSECTSNKIAYIFSSLMFAIYHIFILENSFPLPLVLLILFGLFIGGYIFDFADEKHKNIYNSWVIHMFADFAIMTIWYINI